MRYLAVDRRKYRELVALGSSPTPEGRLLTSRNDVIDDLHYHLVLAPPARSSVSLEPCAFHKSMEKLWYRPAM